MSLVLCLAAMVLFIIEGVRTRSLTAWGLAAFAASFALGPLLARF